jgi:hypothetical protein
VSDSFPHSAAHFVAGHAADAPAALVARVEEVLSAHPSWTPLPPADALLAAGEYLLQGVLRSREENGRSVALDLLAADACVTWAFEAAADTATALPARAEHAMQRIAAVVR